MACLYRLNFARINKIQNLRVLRSLQKWGVKNSFEFVISTAYTLPQRLHLLCQHSISTSPATFPTQHTSGSAALLQLEVYTFPATYQCNNVTSHISQQKVLVLREPPCTLYCKVSLGCCNIVLFRNTSAL